MQLSSKLLIRSAIVMLGLLLVLGLYVSLSFVTTSKANGIVPGCSGTDWQKVQCYANKYIQAQYPGAGVGEGEGSVAASQSTPSGFYVNQKTLHSMLNSSGSDTNGLNVLGEGDDLAKAPVLIDNLNQLTTAIAGTSFRCNWNSATAGNNCFEAGAIADVKTLVDAHEAATGHVPDIVDYCMTDHTAAPATGGWGYIAQTGGLATDGSVPKVYGFTWGRDGWTNTPVTPYTNTNPISAPGATSTYTPPGTVPGGCTSGGGDADLVRCAAYWSIQSTLGNVGNGTTTYNTAGQIVDIRSDTPGQTVDNGSPSQAAVQVPIQTVFNTGLVNVNPSAAGGVLIASASQGPGGIVAEGLRMLGYTTTTGGYIHSGVPYYNNTLSTGQEQPNTGVVYTLQSVSALTSYQVTDTTPPVINSSNATAPAAGSSTENVSRSTSVPATTKIHLTGSDSSTVDTNNTILHASDTENLTGLHPV